MFYGNEASAKKSQSVGDYYGGSAVFLLALQTEIIEMKFEKSKGQGGSVKIISLENKNLLEENQNEISFSDCQFENDDEEKEDETNSNAIFYVGNKKGGVIVDVNNCKFAGKLNKGNHYIDGKLSTNNSPIFHIKSCKFEYDIDDSINKDLIIDSSSIEIINKIPNKGNLRKYIFVFFLSMSTILIILIKMKKMNDKHEIMNEEDIAFVDNIGERPNMSL